MKWSVSQSLVGHFSEKQNEILESNSRFVKPGGRLVYATCSLLRQENEVVLQKFLSTHKNFHPTIPDWNAEASDIRTDEGYVKLFPHRYGTDGFFIALLERDE